MVNINHVIRSIRSHYCRFYYSFIPFQILFYIVIDVAGGDKIPRKGGPGITQSDLLIINKTDLAGIVGADLGVMERDARKMR